MDAAHTSPAASRGPGVVARRSTGRALLRTAAVLSLLGGLGFGLPGLYAIRWFATTGEVWVWMGFPTYGEGPFDDVGLPTSVPLLVAFVTVCAVQVVAGVLLWVGRGAGVVLSLLVLPLGLAFWIGFALPFGPVFGLAAAGCAVAGWRAVTAAATGPGNRP